VAEHDKTIKIHMKMSKVLYDSAS